MRIQVLNAEDSPDNLPRIPTRWPYVALVQLLPYGRRAKPEGKEAIIEKGVLAHRGNEEVHAPQAAASLRWTAKGAEEFRGCKVVFVDVESGGGSTQRVVCEERDVHTMDRFHKKN